MLIDLSVRRHSWVPFSFSSISLYSLQAQDSTLKHPNPKPTIKSDKVARMPPSSHLSMSQPRNNPSREGAAMDQPTNPIWLSPPQRDISFVRFKRIMRRALLPTALKNFPRSLLSSTHHLPIGRQLYVQLPRWNIPKAHIFRAQCSIVPKTTL